MDSRKRKELLEWERDYKKKFNDLLQQAENLKPGVYEVEVAEVLEIGCYHFAPEVAIVKDKEGKIYVIPEYKNYGNPSPPVDRVDIMLETPLGKPLIGRWDVQPGMKLRLIIGEEIIWRQQDIKVEVL